MAIRYSIDRARSRLSVQAFAAGVLAGLAHNPTFAVGEFRGGLRFGPEAADEAAFELAVQADSLRLTDSVRDQDRKEITTAMQNEVLEIAKHPQITFRSTEIAVTKISENWFRLRIQGDMQLHGTTNPQAADAQLRLGVDEMRLSGEFVLSMAAYQIKPVSALGGMVRLKDQLKLTFDLAGSVRSEAQS